MQNKELSQVTEELKSIQSQLQSVTAKLTKLNGIKNSGATKSFIKMNLVKEPKPGPVKAKPVKQAKLAPEVLTTGLNNPGPWKKWHEDKGVLKMIGTGQAVWYAHKDGSTFLTTDGVEISNVGMEYRQHNPDEFKEFKKIPGNPFQLTRESAEVVWVMCQTQWIVLRFRTKTQMAYWFKTKDLQLLDKAEEHGLYLSNLKMEGTFVGRNGWSNSKPFTIDVGHGEMLLGDWDRINTASKD